MAGGDIIVVSVDATSVRVMAPQEGDTDEMIGMKVFILACLHRRNMDPSFDKEMYDWFSQFPPEDFHAAMEAANKDTRMN